MATFNIGGVTVTTTRVQPLPANHERQAPRRVAAELVALLEHGERPAAPP